MIDKISINSMLQGIDKTILYDSNILIKGFVKGFETMKSVKTEKLNPMR